MRAVSRLLIWRPRLRAVWRGREGAPGPSRQDIDAFSLDRYRPDQQREIAKLIASQPIISRGHIADALERAERKVRRRGRLTGIATGLGFVLTFALGILVGRHEQPRASSAEPAVTASATPSASAPDDHWSPGGLDQADREFFAELQSGGRPAASAPPPPRPQSSPVAAPASAPTAARVMTAAAQPVAPQPMTSRQQAVIQLGAFADAAVARARWQALALKFPSLRPLTQTVSAVARGGRTFYRLRASGADAASACSALAGAGTTCFVATDAG